MSRFSCLGVWIAMIIWTAQVSAQTVPTDRDGLEKTEGLGMAMAAEMNGYPGPKHVLELKDSLNLSQEQIKHVQTFFEDMRQEALALGKAIISAEENLNDAFRSGRMTEDSLRVQSTEIGKLRGQLRAVHLGAHLRTKVMLTELQLDNYMRLRGHVKHAHH